MIRANQSTGHTTLKWSMNGQAQAPILFAIILASVAYITFAHRFDTLAAGTSASAVAMVADANRVPPRDEKSAELFSALVDAAYFQGGYVK